METRLGLGLIWVGSGLGLGLTGRVTGRANRAVDTGGSLRSCVETRLELHVGQGLTGRARRSD